MKTIKLLISSFILIFISAACVTTEVARIPEKYFLDNSLERVEKVADLRTGRNQPAFTEFEYAGEDAEDVMARRETLTLSESASQWIKVDEQSFFIRSGSNEYYLLVLHRPLSGLMGMDTITFRLLSNVIVAEKDFIESDLAKYFIDRIYKIESDRQMKVVRSRILGKVKYKAVRGEVI